MSGPASNGAQVAEEAARAPAALLAALEAGALDPADFSHRDHVAVAWAALEEAEERVRRGLQALAAKAGKPGRYDDALTLRWFARIAARRAGLPCAPWAEFLARSPELFHDR